MARFQRGGTAEVDAPEQDGTGTPEQDGLAPDLSATEPSNPDAEDVSGQATSADATEAEVVDLTAFNSAVDALDETEPNYDAVKAEYDKLSRKGKVQATRGISTRSMSELVAGNTSSALKLAKTKNYFASLTPTSTATPTDPTVELVNRIAALRIASAKLTTDELEERIAATVAAPNEIVQALAGKLVEVKAARKPREGGGTRHNVTDHISQVMANQESGTWLDSKALAEASSEEYGGPATKNAVDTKLKSGKFSSDGLSLEERDGKFGVLKA